MTIDDVMDACAAFPAVELGYPFGEGVAVFKVVGKVFALVGAEKGQPIATLKADPEDARALISTYPEVTTGYHMNKKHWISVQLPAQNAPLEELIRDSYDLVVSTLPQEHRSR